MKQSLTFLGICLISAYPNLASAQYVQQQGSIGRGCSGDACNAIRITVDQQQCLRISNKSDRTVQVFIEGNGGSASTGGGVGFAVVGGDTKTADTGPFSCMTVNGYSGTMSANFSGRR